MLLLRSPRRVSFVLAAALFALVLRAAALDVVSWNMEWFPSGPPDRPDAGAAARMVAAREAVLKMAPDVLMVQEIRDQAAFDDLVAGAGELRSRVVSPFRSSETGELWQQQLGIASTLPCVAAWAEPWKPTIPSNPRGPAFAALTEPVSGRLILVYNLHLKSNRSRNDKEAQLNYLWRDESVALLLEHLAEMERVVFRGRVLGVIVGGDMNTNQDGAFGDRVVQRLVEAGFHNTWAGVAPERRPTWRGDEKFPPTTFDYVFTRGLGTPTAEVVETPAEISDHRPVRVRIDIP